MKRKILGLATSFITISFILTSPMLIAGDMPTADGEELWEYITTNNPYSKWDRWPGLPDIYKGSPPHGPYLKVFLNTPALDAAMIGDVMPAGSIVVKENFGPDKKTLISVTTMYKVKGFNPAGADWYWTKHKADGTVERAGKVKGCINCHMAAKRTNWIFNEIK